jgi:ribonuclease P protein component
VLPARHRLRERADFAAVLKGPGGARSATRLLVVHANQTDARADQPPRVGLIVSKGVGIAVVRNRTKRRLRAQLAARVTSVPAGFDIVVRANPVAGQANSSDLGAALDTCLPLAVAKASARHAS